MSSPESLGENTLLQNNKGLLFELCSSTAAFHIQLWCASQEESKHGVAA